MKILFLHGARYMKKLLPFLALILAACSSGGGGSSLCSTNLCTYAGLLAPTSGWTDYGTGTGQSFTGRLSNPFSIPATPVSVNYVYTAPPGSLLGKTMTLNYSVDGNAMFASEDGGTPTLRLLLWENGDTGTDFYRWFCEPGAPFKLGDNQTLSCVITATADWGAVEAEPSSSNVSAFNAAAANPFAVGVTFGGNFTHGIWTTSGSATFTINSFTIQ